LEALRGYCNLVEGDVSAEVKCAWLRWYDQRRWGIGWFMSKLL
jgi:hypothetical protein